MRNEGTKIMVNFTTFSPLSLRKPNQRSLMGKLVLVSTSQNDNKQLMYPNENKPFPEKSLEGKEFPSELWKSNARTHLKHSRINNHYLETK